MRLVSRLALRWALRRARSCADAGDRGGVVSALHAATRHDPTTARRWFDLGRALERDGRPGEATEAYLTAITLDDRHPRWHHRLGRTLERTGDWARAADAYRDAVALGGGRARWHHRLARALAHSDRPDEAVAAYRAAILADPTHPGWHHQLGRTLERTRQWTAAADAYRAAIARSPDRPRSHYRLGRTLERMREWTAAADAYRAAIALDDRVGEWRQRQAGALRRARDPDGVRHVAAAILEQEPHMTPLERRLLDADPRRFDVRRRILRFVAAHLDEIGDCAATPLRPLPSAAAATGGHRIWIYWGQGLRGAPEVVRHCHTQLLRHHGPDCVVALDDRVIEQYVQVSGHARDRTRDDRTKFSDVLRLELLARYGGVWLDATCLPRRDLLATLPELLGSGFFALRYRRARIASWLLASEPGGRVIAALRAAQLVYWRHHDRPVDYYVLHHLFEALFHLDPGVRACWQATPRVSAHTASRFARAMLEPYDDERYRRLLDGAPVHKLTYKMPPDGDVTGTMLAHLLRDSAPATALTAVGH